MARKNTRKLRKGGEINNTTDICTINNMIKGNDKVFEGCLRNHVNLDKNAMEIFLKNNEINVLTFY